MANSVDEYANESFSQEPILLETPRKWDYNEIAEDARTKSTSCTNKNYPTLLVQQCWAMLLPFKYAFNKLNKSYCKLNYTTNKM